MYRIEFYDYIHAFYDQKEECFLVELPRYGLNFKIIGPDVYSVEYDGYKIKDDQTIGTFYGIEQGLKLEEVIVDSEIEYKN